MSVQGLVEKVEKEVQELYVIEKAHLQAFLDFLAKRPYSEVFELVDKMKTARVAASGTVAGAPVTVANVHTDVAPVAAVASDAGVTSGS